MSEGICIEHWTGISCPNRMTSISCTCYKLQAYSSDAVIMQEITLDFHFTRRGMLPPMKLAMMEVHHTMHDGIDFQIRSSLSSLFVFHCTNQQENCFT